MVSKDKSREENSRQTKNQVPAVSQNGHRMIESGQHHPSSQLPSKRLSVQFHRMSSVASQHQLDLCNDPSKTDTGTDLVASPCTQEDSHSSPDALRSPRDSESEVDMYVLTQHSSLNKRHVNHFIPL